MGIPPVVSFFELSLAKLVSYYFVSIRFTLPDFKHQVWKTGCEAILGDFFFSPWKRQAALVLYHGLGSARI